MSEILILMFLRKTAGSIRTPVVLCVLPKGEINSKVTPCGKEKDMNITEITSAKTADSRTASVSPVLPGVE